MTLHADEPGPVDPVAAWAASGAMALSGAADRPGLGPPAGMVPALLRTAERIRTRSRELGQEVRVDPLSLLGERAAISDLRRRGMISCGGATRLLPTADGWIAVSLARPSDLDLLPAWLGHDIDPSQDPWAAVADEMREATTSAAVTSGAGLGLPVGGLPVGGLPTPERHDRSCVPAVRTEQLGSGPSIRSLDRLVVVDLSSLWAGPLCGSLLGLAGAEVWKVESSRRPDGARRGPAQFFDLMNSGKRSIAFDFSTPAGRRTLQSVVEHADVVIEASRPRALEQLGISAAQVLHEGRPRLWVSITGHGRGPAGRNRTGFGDDAAVAGGLVSWDGPRPSFCADAIADPLTGLVAAASSLDLLAEGGSWLLDASMATVAAHHAGPTLPAPAGIEAAPPTARPAGAAARAMGEDTAAILASIDGER